MSRCAAANKFADDFFSRFNEIVSDRAAPASVPPPEPVLERRRGLPALVWAPALVIVVGLLLLLLY